MLRFEHRKDLSARRLARRGEKDPRGFALAPRLDDLVKAVELEALGDLEFFPHGRDLPERQDDRLFLGDMKDDPLFFDLQIAAEHFQVFEQAEREPAFILRGVDIGVETDEDREEKQERPEKERINKKFAHTVNMSEQG